MVYFGCISRISACHVRKRYPKLQVLVVFLVSVHYSCGSLVGFLHPKELYLILCKIYKVHMYAFRARPGYPYHCGFIEELLALNPALNH